ncbi:hypothetical protein M513_08022 [Trichuris suis]|uniref:Secreted protein n=1 Tax=Trichuris suis TaxID=68888 RepID=A0A085M1M6_9BILA|nr:hypothetical protein M513_08022 [Trichuris suis]
MMLFKNLAIVLLFLFYNCEDVIHIAFKNSWGTLVCSISKAFLSRLSIKTSASTGDRGYPLKFTLKREQRITQQSVTTSFCLLLLMTGDGVTPESSGYYCKKRAPTVK